MKRVRDRLPSDLEPELEAARLDRLALFRALDRVGLAAAEIPQGLLRELFELDADFAEALHVLDFPLRGLDLRAMTADTRASLRRLPPKRRQFLDGLPARAVSLLDRSVATIRASLALSDARHSIPVPDPRDG